MKFLYFLHICIIHLCVLCILGVWSFHQMHFEKRQIRTGCKRSHKTTTVNGHAHTGSHTHTHTHAHTHTRRVAIPSVHSEKRILNITCLVVSTRELLSLNGCFNRGACSDVKQPHTQIVTLLSRAPPLKYSCHTSLEPLATVTLSWIIYWTQLDSAWAVEIALGCLHELQHRGNYCNAVCLSLSLCLCVHVGASPRSRDTNPRRGGISVVSFQHQPPGCFSFQ